MSQPNDLSRCLVSLDQDTTLIAVIELSQSSWLIAGTVPGVERQPLKKIVADEAALMRSAYEGWRTLDAKERDLLLEVIGHVLRGVVVLRRQAARDGGREPAEMTSHTLRDRL